MQVRFRFFSFLKGKTGEREMRLKIPKTATLKEALEILIEKTPLVPGDLLEDRKKIKNRIIVLVNGKSLHNELSTQLSDGDKISLMPSIGGGTFGFNTTRS